MKIGGFQKMTLTDFPDCVASIIFTSGCNFRCLYCHNPELVKNPDLKNFPEDEILDYLKSKRYFLDGVVITGGEPTLQPDLLDFIRKIKELGLMVKLDTNGTVPHVVKTLVQQKLVDYIAMDVKASWRNYPKITKVPGLVENCRKTMQIIQSSDIDHEFRTTVYKKINTQSDIAEIRSYLRPNDNYFLQDLRTGICLDESLNHKGYEQEKVAV